MKSRKRAPGRHRKPDQSNRYTVALGALMLVAGVGVLAWGVIWGFAPLDLPAVRWH